MSDDGFRYELVKGELRKMTPAGFSHGKAVANLTGPLATFVKAKQLGVVLGAETGFKLATDPDTVLAPDIAFVRKERFLEVGDTEKFWPGPPDLAVEVLSPSDTAYDVEEKITSWLTAGVTLVWLLNPKQRTLHVYCAKRPTQTLGPEDMLDGQEVIPGFRISVSEIFA
jgi:Uma2 family endonuclease